ncbi:MAG: hypothetical protein RLY21_2590 [Planctomycetota bacterium]
MSSARSRIGSQIRASAAGVRAGRRRMIDEGQLGARARRAGVHLWRAWARIASWLVRRPPSELCILRAGRKRSSRHTTSRSCVRCVRQSFGRVTFAQKFDWSAMFSGGVWMRVACTTGAHPAHGTATDRLRVALFCSLPDGAGSLCRANVQDLCGKPRSPSKNRACPRAVRAICDDRGRRARRRREDGQAEGIRDHHDSRSRDRPCCREGDSRQAPARQDAHHQRSDEEGCGCCESLEGGSPGSIRSTLQSTGRWESRCSSRWCAPRIESRASWSKLRSTGRYWHWRLIRASGFVRIWTARRRFV